MNKKEKRFNLPTSAQIVQKLNTKTIETDKKEDHSHSLVKTQLDEEVMFFMNLLHASKIYATNFALKHCSTRLNEMGGRLILTYYFWLLFHTVDSWYILIKDIFCRWQLLLATRSAWLFLQFNSRQHFLTFIKPSPWLATGFILHTSEFRVFAAFHRAKNYAKYIIIDDFFDKDRKFNKYFNYKQVCCTST